MGKANPLDRAFNFHFKFPKSVTLKANETIQLIQTWDATTNTWFVKFKFLDTEGKVKSETEEVIVEQVT